ncbi:fap1 adhesin isoform X1 [Embiotoca jacksoni]|uniref:fap1 adhesin isoform X1 n=1 Tax=Embiotoca jacksoni TaxID=100190 RepID=UPI003704557F
MLWLRSTDRACLCVVDVDRNKVFQTTRVRTTLKNDGCWIHRSKADKEEQDKAGTIHDVETKPSPVQQSSHILMTARKFESIDSSQSPPLHKTKDIAFEGDSDNKANGEIILARTDAQPEGSTVETADDTKPQALIEELIQNRVEQPEKSAGTATAENKEEGREVAVDKSNVEHSDGAAEVSADVHQAECIQPVSLARENPEALCPVEPAEQPLAITTAENKEVHVDTPADPSDHNEAKVSADANVENLAAEITAVGGTEEHESTLAVEREPHEGSLIKTEPLSATNLEVKGISAQPTEGICETCPPENVTEEVVAVATKVIVESWPETADVTDATAGEEASLQVNVESVPNLLLDSASKSPETPAKNIGTPGEEAALQNIVQPVPDALSKPPAQPAAKTAVRSEECKVESAAQAETVLKTTTEAVVDCEVHTVFEQSAEPTAESSAASVVELNIEDAVEPATASVSETVWDNVVDKHIKLTDALDVEPPTAETDRKPVEEPKQSHTEELKVNHQCDDTNITEVFEKPAEEINATDHLNKIRVDENTCSLCNHIIDGNVKISFNEPPVRCHPGCLKCGVCAMALGDMLTPMFLRDLMILCGGCFAKALKI